MIGPQEVRLTVHESDLGQGGNFVLTEAIVTGEWDEDGGVSNSKLDINTLCRIFIRRRH